MSNNVIKGIMIPVFPNSIFSLQYRTAEQHQDCVCNFIKIRVFRQCQLHKLGVRGLIQFKTTKISSLAPEGEHFPRDLFGRYPFLPAQLVEIVCGSGYKIRLRFSPPLTVSYQRICLPCICGVELLEQGKKPGAVCSLLLSF